MSSISRYSKIYCHITLSGGYPGENTTLKAVAYWPDRSTTTVKWDNETWMSGGTGSAFFWYDTPSNGARGTFTVKIYAGSSVIGQESIKIVN